MRKMTFPMTISLEALHLYGGCRDGSHQERGHWEARPWSIDEIAQYEAIKARWEAAKAEWEAIQSEAINLGWATHGTTDDEPKLSPLPAAHEEWVQDETYEEWRDRILTAHAM